MIRVWSDFSGVEADSVPGEDEEFPQLALEETCFLVPTWVTVEGVDLLGDGPVVPSLSVVRFCVDTRASGFGEWQPGDLPFALRYWRLGSSIRLVSSLGEVTCGAGAWDAAAEAYVSTVDSFVRRVCPWWKGPLM